MTEIQQLLKKLEKTPKTYFTYKDIVKYYSGKEKVLKVLLSRLVKQNRIVRLMRGFYALNISSVDYESLSCELLKPGYISFEYALWKYGLINEIPANITLATTKKTRFYKLQNTGLEYTHIDNRLFFGYKVEKNILIAEKEKALLDEFYLISLGKRSLNTEKIDYSKLNKQLFKKWLEKYPKTTKDLFEKLI